MSRFRNPARALAAAVLPAAATALCLLLSATPGRAQTTTPTYVSNINQGGADYFNIGYRRAAQGFRTGSQDGGYILTSVDIGSDDGEADEFSAAIHSIDSSGNPSGEGVALTPPSSFAKGTLTFTAPANTSLAASTPYTVLITASMAEDDVRLATTTHDGEDAVAAENWSIDNSLRTKSGTDSWTSHPSAAIRIAIRGSTTVDYPPTGSPMIDGTAEVGETLTANTSSIADSNGLTEPSYTYQWVANDGTSDMDIAGAIDSTYTLVAADLGKAIKVRVSFTDDDGYSKTLTSLATTKVLSVPGAPTDFKIVENGHHASLVTWTAPIDDGGSAITGYRIEGTAFRGFDTGSTSTSHLIVKSSRFDGVIFAMRVHAVNAVGKGPPSRGSPPDDDVDDLYVPLTSAKVTIVGGESVVEGSEAVFTLTPTLSVLSADAPMNVRVLVSESGDMVASADEGTKTVSFALNATTASLSVPTVNDEATTDIDDAVEFDSIVTATITPDSDYIVISPSEASVLVEDNEPHNFPYLVEDLSARASGDGSVTLAWTAVTEQRGERISRFEYSQAKGSEYPENSDDSRIVATLWAGEYTIEATTFRMSGHSAPEGSYTLSVSIDEGMGAEGQEASGCARASLSLPVRVEGTWRNDCLSSVPDRGQSRFFTFSLAESAEVTILLESGSHDPHLYLREGSSTSGPALHENGDIGSWLHIIRDSDDTTTGYTVTGLTNGVSYSFRVRAVNAIGPADPSNTASATPRATVTPYEIEDLSGTAGSSEALLSWTAPHEGGSPITKYQYRQKNGGAYGGWKNISGSGPATDSFTVPDLRVGVSYTFQVRAVNSHGEADASNEASVTVLAGVLLENLDQTSGGVSNNNINNFNDTSQPFTTGSGPNIGSYTLQSINIVGAAALSTLPALTVTLEADSSGNPSGTPLCTFTNPSVWKSGPNNEFTLATPCRLDPSVKYHIAMDAGGALQMKHNNGGTADDDISADNWEFHTRRREDSSNGWEAPASASAFRMSLFGAIGLAPDAIGGVLTGLRATAFDEEALLFWDSPGDGGSPITRYQYRQKAGSGDYGDWKNISRSHRWQPQHTVTGLTNGTRYTFQVRAVNAGGEAPPSNEATASPRDDDCRQSSNESACIVSPGASFQGSIEVANIDNDWVKLVAKGGATYQIDLAGQQGGQGTLPDPSIAGLYTRGALVEFGLGRIPDTYNDDVSPAKMNARVVWTAHRDIEVWISVVSSHKNPMGMGTYTLTVTHLSSPPPPPAEPPPPPATLTLVSNFNVGERRIVTIMDPDPEHYNHVTEFSQPFTTGSNSQGYALGSIGLIARGWLDRPPPLIVTLRPDFGGSGIPSSTVLATLTNPPSWKPVGPQGPDGGLIFSIFRAPSGTTLNPNTKYHIHILPDRMVKLETVRDLGETGGSLSGWDMMNSLRKTRNNERWHTVHHPFQAVRLGVFGLVTEQDLETGQQTSQAAATFGAPKIFIATAKGPAKVDLIWTTPEFGAATGYGIQRSTDGETWQAVEPPDDGGDTMYRHAGLTPETTYHYRMRYLTEDGPGEWTHPVAATTTADAWRLTAAAVSKTQVDLSWTAPGEEFTGYHVEWSADGETGWTATDPLHSGTEAGYSHNGLTEGTTYHYRVLAVNGNIPGPWSPVVSATTEAAPNTPATGAPAITGAARVGETLAANTSGIADEDGLTNATFTYQWLAGGADISGAADSTYVPVVDDAGRAIGVRVSFTDDRGFEETLTGAAGTVPADDYTVNEIWETGNWGRVTVGGSATGVVEVPGDRDFFGVNLSRGRTYRIDVAGHGDVGALEQVRLYGVFVYAEDLECSGAYDDPGVTTYVLTAGHSAPHSVAVRADGDGTGVYRVSVSESGDTGAGCDTAPAAEPQAANTPATGAPAVTGTVRVGETLTADTSGIADEDGLDNAAFSYQWLAGDAEISGATGSAYTLAGADKGKAINVKVSFTDDAGNAETLTSAATAAVEARPNNPATGVPTISGTAQVGETLTADTSGIADEDGLDTATYSYQWQAGDADIPGATSGTYTPAEADEGTVISVAVSFTDDAGNEEESTSAATDAVAAKPNSPATGAPAISGTAQVGETLTADTSGIADEDGLTNASFAYQWQADGVAIQDATDSTYTLVDADEGKAISVKVTFTDDAGNEETLTSAATDAVDAKPNTPATGEPTISGTAQVGETLTADTSGIADDDGLDNVSYSYQWLADGADIAGATNENYTLTHSDEDKAISVTVSFTDDGGNEESLTSAATDAVEARPNSPATGQPAISGTAQVGETLTADTSEIADADGLDNAAFSFQWISNSGSADSEIGGATGSTYILASDDVGRTIKVRVSFTDDAGNAETLTSGPTDAVAGLPPPPLTASMENVATSHDGESVFTFELRFSEEFGISYKTLRDHAFTVTGGTVKKAQRLEQGSNARWEITVQPDGNGDVTVVLPATDDCAAQGAICAGDGRMLSNRLELAVAGPVAEEEQQQDEPEPENSPATGQPTITGAVQVGETLTAVTSDIEDDDGLTNASFSYQWLAGDADISGATGSTYTLADADEGQAVQVRVSFADDAGNEESLTSAATAAVEPAPAPPPAPADLTAVVENGNIVLNWSVPSDESVTGYQVLRRRPHEGEETLLVYVENTGSTATTFTDTDVTSGVRYVYRVKAINSAGVGAQSNFARATP